MESVNTPKNVSFTFHNFCEDCPYSELDIVEDMWECGVSTLVTCKNEDICKRVNWVTRKEIDGLREEKK